MRILKKLFHFLDTCFYLFIFFLYCFKIQEKRMVANLGPLHYCSQRWMRYTGPWWHSYWFDVLKSVVTKLSGSGLCCNSETFMLSVYDYLSNHVIRDDCESRKGKEILRHQNSLALNKGLRIWWKAERWNWDQKKRADLLAQIVFSLSKGSHILNMDSYNITFNSK